MKISIITACCNAAKTIKTSLECIDSQKVQCEHVIVDGGSLDNTLEICNKYASPHRYIKSEPDQGIYDAMNKGINRSTGDIIGILNADDFYPSPDVLTWVSKAFSHPSVQACYGNLQYVRTDDVNTVTRYWKSGNYRRELFYQGWMPPHPTFFVRRELYQRYGKFRLELGSAADYELMLRFLVKHRIDVAYIPKVLVKMRSGGVSNASLKNRLLANKMDRKAWEVNGLRPRPWTLYLKPLQKINQYVLLPTHY